MIIGNAVEAISICNTAGGSSAWIWCHVCCVSN